jgi:hypothetical protein
MLTKTGVHSQHTSEPGFRWACKAPIAKGLNLGWLRDAKRKNPTLFTIYRHPLDDSEKESVGPDELANRVLNEIVALGFTPDAVEYKNEWRCYANDNAMRHIIELRQFCARLHAHGIKVVGGNWSFGTPDKIDVDLWRQERWGDIDYLGIHLYTNVDVWLNNRWIILRHQIFHEWTEGDHPPMIGTEVGFDDFEGRGAGWKKQGCSAETYVKFIQDLDLAIRSDDYLIGVVVFTAAPEAGMEDFTTDEISDEHILPLYDGTARIIPWSPSPAQLPMPTTPKEESPTVSMYTIGNLSVIDLREVLAKNGEYNLRELGVIQRIIIHHSATGETSAERINQYHIDTNGWPRMGYHFLVHQDGIIEYCNDIARITYGAAGANTFAIHICLVGNYESDDPQPEQLLAARLLVENLRFALGRVYPVIGHREVNSTVCPGTNWEAWKNAIIGTVPGTGNQPGVPGPAAGTTITLEKKAIEDLVSTLQGVLGALETMLR